MKFFFVVRKGGITKKLLKLVVTMNVSLSLDVRPPNNIMFNPIRNIWFPKLES